MGCARRRRFSPRISPRTALAQDLVLPLADPQPFDHAWLVGEAERLAKEGYREPSHELPDGVNEIDYDQYRNIRYRAEARIWSGTDAPFTLDLFHPGWYYTQPVHIALVADGKAQFIIATHSPILLTFPGAQILAFDGPAVRPTSLEETSHFQITKGILQNPAVYWKHLQENDR